ncbi:MAG TPA: MFS transporter [Trebonia sp.]|nr:MFS transporter [Trebonia sp.]
MTSDNLTSATLPKRPAVATRPPAGGLSRGLSCGLTAVLALTSAVTVGNIYFPQAVVPLAAAGLHVAPTTAATAVTATQVGYTAGIATISPLADRLPQRRLLIVLLMLNGLALLAAGAAPTVLLLVLASALVGVTCVAAQVTGLVAAGLVAADRQGAAIGILLSGSTAGMLLARAFSGVLGEHLGWRVPYLVAVAVVLLLAIVARFTVPVTAPSSRQPYRALLAESLRLLRTEAGLRHSCVNQAAVFGAFSAIWTCVGLLLTGPSYRLGAGAVGALALVGAATVGCTPVVGRLVDRRGPDAVNLVCMLAVLAAAALMAEGARGGPIGLAALILGVLLLDVAMQSGMTANKARVYALRPDARGRLNTAFMTCAYAGGSLGSWAGVHAWSQAGWPGVCALTALLTLLALATHRLAVRRGR